MVSPRYASAKQLQRVKLTSAVTTRATIVALFYCILDSDNSIPVTDWLNNDRCLSQFAGDSYT